MNEGSEPLFEKLQPTKVGGDSLKEMVRLAFGPNSLPSLTPHSVRDRTFTPLCALFQSDCWHER